MHSVKTVSSPFLSTLRVLERIVLKEQKATNKDVIPDVSSTITGFDRNETNAVVPKKNRYGRAGFQCEVVEARVTCRFDWFQ